MVSKLGVLAGGVTDTFTKSMTAGNYYDFNVDYREEHSWANLKAYWTTASIAKEIIPAAYFYTPNFIGSNPYQITVNCPTGYNGNDASSLYQCVLH